MATAAQMRKLALALPEVEESAHFEQPDFRVRKKIFAGLSRDEKRGTLKLTSEIQATVVGEDDVFTPCPGAWGRSGWTFVDLARVDVATLRALLEEAWRIIAPKKLVTSLDDAAPVKAKPKRSSKKRA